MDISINSQSTLRFFLFSNFHFPLYHLFLIVPIIHLIAYISKVFWGSIPPLDPSRRTVCLCYHFTHRDSFAPKFIELGDKFAPPLLLFKTLKWLPFLNRVQFNTAILMYKSVNGQSPIYLKNMFQFCSDQRGHLTRSNTSHNLVPPPIKIELFKHSFTYQGIVL